MASNGSSSQCWGADQRIAVGDVKFVVVNIMQEHVDAAEVVGRDIDLLPIKSLPDIAEAEDLRCFQKQRTGTAGGIQKHQQYHRKAKIKQLLFHVVLPYHFSI